MIRPGVLRGLRHSACGVFRSGRKGKLTRLRSPGVAGKGRPPSGGGPTAVSVLHRRNVLSLPVGMRWWNHSLIRRRTEAAGPHCSRSGFLFFRPVPFCHEQHQRYLKYDEESQYQPPPFRKETSDPSGLFPRARARISRNPDIHLFALIAPIPVIYEQLYDIISLVEGRTALLSGGSEHL